MFPLKGRVALVTGGSRGLGRGIALELAKRGASVAVNYLTNMEAAQEVINEIENSGGIASAVQADVSQNDQANVLIQSVVEHYGKLDILINNAGTIRDRLITRMTEEDWDTVIDTNLKSAWNCSRAAVKVMLRRRYGRIINMTSVSGITGQAGNSNYSASKAGLIGLTKALAREVGSRQITVNAVAPGLINVGMTGLIPPEMQAEIQHRIPLGCWGDMNDVAQAVAFLADDSSKYITGQVLCVDGGLSMG